MGDAVNTDSQGSLDRTDAAEKVAREVRCCPTCGARFSATAENESCPVCLLREAREKTVEPAPVHATQRFEHYEVTLGEDGRPLELGRGSMGITYKAVDVDLHCPVTLKVISEKYLGDEAARVRLCGRRVPRRACVIPMSPPSSILGEREALTSMRWSLSREKPWAVSSGAPDALT